MSVQFLECLKSFFDVPSDFRVDGDSFVQDWTSEFERQLYSSRFGYPNDCPVWDTPVLEDRLIEFGKKKGLSFSEAHRTRRPTIYVSHDIDYLETTLQLKIKDLVYKRGGWMRDQSFLDDIDRMLATDREFVGATSVFLARPKPSRKLSSKARQWLIDPSYDLADSEAGVRMREILGSIKTTLGCHGSFFSIAEGFVGEERRSLEEIFGVPIRHSRQHWLNLPGPESFDVLKSSGFECDSSLGWNGHCGFRGGISRDFGIVTKSGVLKEVPMLLMDGVLFVDLKLDELDALQVAQNLLEQVFSRNGAVAVNWHDRSFSKAFGWGDLYKRILEWARKKEFAIEAL